MCWLIQHLYCGKGCVSNIGLSPGVKILSLSKRKVLKTTISIATKVQMKLMKQVWRCAVRIGTLLTRQSCVRGEVKVAPFSRIISSAHSKMNADGRKVIWPTTSLFFYPFCSILCLLIVPNTTLSKEVETIFSTNERIKMLVTENKYHSVLNQDLGDMSCIVYSGPPFLPRNNTNVF